MNPKNPRVTLRQIGAAAGVSHTAVSLSLRNDPSIPPSSRERIRAIAAKLGYQPDPFVSALLSRVRTGRTPKLRAKLAFVNAFQDYERWSSSRTNLKFHAGAAARASELGFELEDFHPAIEGVSFQRLSKILSSRGVRGIVLALLPNTGGTIDMNWDPFAAASQGYTVIQPEHHRSCHHHWDGMIQVCEHLLDLGYERPGLALTFEASFRVRHLWLGAYQSFFAARGETSLPAYLETEPKISLSGFLQWQQTYRPDAIITADAKVAQILNSSGIKAPKDIGLVHLDLHVERDSGWAGIDQNAGAVGARAVELVVEQIRNNEYGLPDEPKVVLTLGAWVSGSTVRSRKRPSAHHRGGAIQKSKNSLAHG